MEKSLRSNATPARWRTSWWLSVRLTPVIANVNDTCSMVDPWPDSITRPINSRCLSGVIRPSTARSKMSSGASSE